MQPNVVEAIQNHPRYRELVEKRTRFCWLLSIIILAIYFGFILTIAFVPSVLGTKLFDDSVISLGIPVGIAIILSAFVLTGIYVVRANGEFDRITQEIKNDTNNS